MENLRDLLNYVHKTRWARQRTEEKSYAKARLFVDFVGATASCSSLEAADVRTQHEGRGDDAPRRHRHGLGAC
jgi:hypothetical protein